MARFHLVVDVPDSEAQEAPVLTFKEYRALRMLAAFESREEQPAPEGAETEDESNG